MLNTVSESALQEANLQQLVQEEVQKSIYRDEILEMDNLMLSGSEDPIIRGGRSYLPADHKHSDPRQFGTRRLMILTPDYITTSQSEEGPRNLLPHLVFKNLSLKATGEFRSFEHELPGLLAWCPAINAAFSFTTTQCR